SGKPLGLNYVSNDATQFVARAWSTGATIGTARTSAMSAVYNNKIYVWGGATNTGSTVYTNTLEIYNITTNTWSTGTAGGTARRNGKSIVYRGKIYFFFGCTNAACTTYATAVDVYDILTDSWSTATSGGTGRGGFTASLYNGKVYIWAGCAGACANVNTLDIYDIPSNSWTTGVAGGTARRNADSGLYNGKIYNYGGLTGVVVNTIDIYDIATSTWSTGLAGGTARSLPNVNIYNGKLYSTHGFTTVGVNTTDVYDIDKNVWSTGLAGGTAGYTGTSVIVGANIYVISGLNSASSAMLSTVDILNLGYKSEDIFNISSTSSSTNGTSAPDDGKLFRFDAVGRAYTSAQGGWFSVGADYAEYMHTEDTSIEAGDIVSLDLTDGKSIVKAKSGDSTIIGAISTEPGFVGNIISLEDINSNNPNWKLMSMVGQVPVKVKGNISVGDAITGSDIEGVGRKANYGEANIGIAQDNHSSESIDTIGVLITRNNSGISNNIQIDFGKQSEGGFRLSDSGKMQFKDKSGDWKNIADSSTITDALLWEQRGDNALLSSDSNLVIGLDQSNASDTKLQVLKDLESRSGLSFLKITASGSIQFNNENVGFRVNESTNGIEFRDATTGEWKSLSGLLISRIRFNKDIQSDQVNQVQINGWDYLESDGINSQLLKTINFPVEYKYQPFVSLGIIGESNTKPEKPSDCSDISNVKKINASEVSNKSFKVNITAPVEVGKYYCYTWLAN
ncbi:MAG: kelch repeat-containing protein, partial [Candidatus Dojkabacteria bacterium]